MKGRYTVGNQTLVLQPISSRDVTGAEVLPEDQGETVSNYKSCGSYITSWSLN